MVIVAPTVLSRKDCADPGEVTEGKKEGKFEIFERYRRLGETMCSYDGVFAC